MSGLSWLKLTFPHNFYPLLRHFGVYMIKTCLPFSFLLKITGLQEENFKFTGPLQEVYQIFTGDLQEIFIFHRRITGFYITDFHLD